MRRMAVRALAGFHRIVLELHGLQKIVVAPKTGIGQRFLKVAFDVRTVRIVAFEAIALRRWMFNFFLGGRILVAFEAHRPAGTQEEFLVRRRVRAVAGCALAERGGIMREFDLCEKVLVALKTKCREKPLHLDPGFDIVAFGALAGAVRRVN